MRNALTFDLEEYFHAEAFVGVVASDDWPRLGSRVTESTLRLLDALDRWHVSATFFVLGVTYKRDVNDVRESPALEIIRMMMEKGAHVSYADPLVPQLTVSDLKLVAVPLTAEALRRADCVVVATDHRAFDYALVAREAPLVVDLRNALGAVRDGRDHIVTL